MPDFQTSINELQEITVVKLAGYLDAHTAPQLEDLFARQIERQRYKIAVDFADLKYISSAGLGVFMAFIEDLRKNGGDIKLASMQPNVFNIFDLLGFPLLYEIYNSTEEAVQKYQSK